ncbi:MAG: hypothetical protein ABIP39_05755 [Polyangiaceae bacterium]
MARFLFAAALALFPVLGCSSVNVVHVSADSGADDAAVEAGSSDDASTTGDASTDKAGPCASSFGTALTPAFARIDGTVVAVVPPNDQACALPNSTHLVIQVMMGGAVYRMVVDVLSSTADPDSGTYDVSLSELDAPLAAGAWAEGWHPGFALDYVSTLDVHSPAFTAMKQADLVAKITSEIELGDHISIFATATSAEPNSAHLVHRNHANADGAIVVHPDSANPHYLLLRFSEQTF